MQERLTGFLEKLLRLEQEIGAEAPDTLLPPLDLDPKNPADLQRVARRIGTHLGLSHTFVVAIAKQKGEHTGGHVDLHDSESEVFIELSERVIDYPVSAVAGLAHEVTHKYLHAHRVTWTEGVDPVRENEELTDLCAVWAGMGLLLLNGSVQERVEQVSPSEQVIHRFQGGYLTQAELAAIHLMVGRLRGWSPEQLREGLTEAARRAVTEAERTTRRFVRDHGAGPEAGVVTAAMAEGVIRDHQTLLAGLERDLTYLRDLVIPRVTAFLEVEHRRLYRGLGEVEDLQRDDGGGAAGPLLVAVAAHRVRLLRGEQRRRGSSINRLRRGLARAVGGLLGSGAPLPAPEGEMFRVVTCRVDGQKLRIPAGRSVVTRCPSCRYRFRADSTDEGPPKRVGRRWPFGRR